MTSLRNIWADLVEKRLWPVAVLLLAGIVAVPVVLAKSPASDSIPTPAADAVLASAANRDETTIVTLDTDPRVRRHDGRGRDPFVQPKGSTPQKAQALESSTAGKGGAGGGAGADTAGGAGGGGTSGEPVSVTPVKAPAKAKPKSNAPAYTIDLRFGQADSMKTLRDVARLTPLPSAASPFFVFLGVKEDGKTLVFLVSSDAKATGDGKCKPSAKACETIELKSGDTEFFDLSTDTGVEQYQMDIVKVSKTSGSSSAKSARKARAASRKASKADRRILRKVLDGRSAHLMGTYRWVPARGVLVHVPAWADKD